MVLVDEVPKSGDIVIARVDGEWTMKYLRKRGESRKRSESVVLLPANSRYQPIRPKKELKIAGVVMAVFEEIPITNPF